MLYNLFENRDFVSVFAVALLAEGVDRNVHSLMPPLDGFGVALLAEGVDRNTMKEVSTISKRKVALLAEGVDRNLDAKDDPQRLKGRPPRGGRG